MNTSNVKNSTQKILVLGLVVILIFVAFYTYNKKFSKFLPDNFTAILEQDSTSSGGSRYTSATLTFKNSTLNEGTLTYTYSRETTTKTTCVFDGNAWLNADGSVCTINFITIPVTKKDFQNLIKEKKIKPLGDLCRHYDVCYTIER